MEAYPGYENKDFYVSWLQTRPDRILELASEKRSIGNERAIIEAYLSEQVEGYKQLLNNLAEQIPSMRPECRAAVLVPVYNEEMRLPQFIRSYLKQLNVSPKNWEITFLINREEGDVGDDSRGVIKSIAQKHHEFSINVVEHVFPKGKGGLAKARKLLYDITLFRSLNRLSQSGCLYLVSEDADLISIDRRVIETVIKELDKHPRLDALRGEKGYDPEAMLRVDLLYFTRTTWKVLKELLSNPKYREKSNYNYTWNRIITGGWNTAFTAQIYGLIGGYDPDTKAAEDMQIGERITAIRGNIINDELVANFSTIERMNTLTFTSTRRYILALLRKEYAYANFNDLEFNTVIRKLSDKELSDRAITASALNEKNLENFEKEIKYLLDFAIHVTKSEKQAKSLITKALKTVSFHSSDYKLTPTPRIHLSQELLSRFKKQKEQHYNESMARFKLY